MIFSKSVTFVILSSFLLRKKINYLIVELQNSLKYGNNTSYLRNHMLITEPLSSELHYIYLSQAEKLQDVTSRKRRSAKESETIVEDQEELLVHENAPRVSVS